MSPPDQFIRDINAEKVAAPLLGEVMTMWASLPAEKWNDFDLKLQRGFAKPSRLDVFAEGRSPI